MIEKEFNNRISTKSTAKREKYATFMGSVVILGGLTFVNFPLCIHLC